MQQSMASSFEELMKDVARSLTAKNRDKYANILVQRLVILLLLQVYTEFVSVP